MKSMKNFPNLSKIQKFDSPLPLAREDLLKPSSNDSAGEQWLVGPVCLANVCHGMGPKKWPKKS